jgi:hypothetical protein
MAFIFPKEVIRGKSPRPVRKENSKLLTAGTSTSPSASQQKGLSSLEHAENARKRRRTPQKERFLEKGIIFTGFSF